MDGPKIIEQKIILKMAGEIKGDSVYLPGTIYFRDKEGQQYPVDFRRVEGNCGEDLHTAIFTCKNPLEDTFPDLQDIVPRMDEIISIDEMYLTPLDENVPDIGEVGSLEIVVAGMEKMPKDTDYFTFTAGENGNIVCKATETLLGTCKFFVEG